jgi:putative addiction module CopG family antidote
MSVDMNILLHPDIVKFIDEQVSAGGYRSPDEVVTEALFLLWQRDQAGDAPDPAGTSPDCRH